MTTATQYTIIDSLTGAAVVSKPFANRRAAQSKADRMDSKYGAVRFIVKPLF